MKKIIRLDLLKIYNFINKNYVQYKFEVSKYQI